MPPPPPQLYVCATYRAGPINFTFPRPCIGNTPGGLATGLFISFPYLPPPPHPSSVSIGYPRPHHNVPVRQKRVSGLRRSGQPSSIPALVSERSAALQRGALRDRQQRQPADQQRGAEGCGELHVHGHQHPGIC